MKRRDFISLTAPAAAAYLAGPTTSFGTTTRASATTRAVATTQTAADGFFTLGRRGNRWILLTPDRQPFFSTGLNHIDSSSLRYPENLARWEQHYDNDTLKWIRESVAPNLRSWGFNSVGWVQEISVRQHAHTRAFTLEEYRALEMPFCHLLPFIETHQWNQSDRNPDLFSPAFEDWCDYVARAHCGRLRNESQLIGYFYSDCPTWVHTQSSTHWRGPMFDPERLQSDVGRQELSAMARRYYQVTHDAIRRYDPHHLILGDRYEANARLPLEIINAAIPFVDVLSFQDFKNPVERLQYWHNATGMPVLMADGTANRAKVTDESGTYREGSYALTDGNWYAETVAGLLLNPGAIGAHLCGAYIRNRHRGRGLVDEQEIPDEIAIHHLKTAHESVNQWLAKFDA